MLKLVKKYIITAIVFFVAGLLYGSIFNFILSVEEVSAFWAYVKGILVGFFAVTIYLYLTFLLGYCFDQEYVTNMLRKTGTILINAVAFFGMCYGITMIIGNNKPIPIDYAWMHILNWLFVGVVVGKANYDGNVLRNFIKESERNK